jgi:hypothetical protein
MFNHGVHTSLDPEVFTLNSPNPLIFRHSHLGAPAHRRIHLTHAKHSSRDFHQSTAPNQAGQNDVMRALGQISSGDVVKRTLVLIRDVPPVGDDRSAHERRIDANCRDSGNAKTSNACERGSKSVLRDPTTHYKMAANEHLPSLRLAGAIRFDPQDLVNC